MQSKKYVPLKIDLIDEGRFTQELDECLTELQSLLIAHVKQHKHKAKKAKASLKVEITLVCLEPDDEAYGCIHKIKKVLPAAPPVGSILVQADTAEGKPLLFCRVSGSSKDNPSQEKICTDDGRSINQLTGEIEEMEAEEIVGQEFEG